jgi:hypothetical protein
MAIRVAHLSHTQGIDPALDPNTLDLFDPRNPLNQRRRNESGVVVSAAPPDVDYKGDGGREHMLRLERMRDREREAKLLKLEAMRFDVGGKKAPVEVPQPNGDDDGAQGPQLPPDEKRAKHEQRAGRRDDEPRPDRGRDSDRDRDRSRSDRDGDDRSRERGSHRSHELNEDRGSRRDRGSDRGRDREGERGRDRDRRGGHDEDRERVSGKDERSGQRRDRDEDESTGRLPDRKLRE